MPEEKPKYKRPRTEAQRAGEARYKAENLKRFTLSLNRNTDADIIHIIEIMPNKQAFFKNCIREWMMRNICSDPPRPTENEE